MSILRQEVLLGIRFLAGGMIDLHGRYPLPICPCQLSLTIFLLIIGEEGNKLMKH